MKLILRTVIALLGIVVLSSCQREKSLYEDTVRGTYKINDCTYTVTFDPSFDKIKHIDSIETKGTIKIGHTTENNRYEYIEYGICDLGPIDDSTYVFKGVCVDEAIFTEEKKGKGKSKGYDNDNDLWPHIGLTQEMSICYNSHHNQYELFLGKCPLNGFPDENICVAIPTGLTTSEAATPATSILDPYLCSHIGTVKLYPSKYWPEIFIEWEWAMLLAAAIIVVLAILVGDWLSAIAVPIAIYFSLYTSWMICLPGLILLVLIPLSYIRYVPASLTFFCPFISICLGLYILFDIYHGSTLWNMILLAVVWLFGIAFICLIAIGWCFLYRRCDDCGRPKHRLRRDSNYESSANAAIFNYIPTSYSGEFNLPSSLKGTAKKEEEPSCCHCQ